MEISGDLSGFSSKWMPTDNGTQVDQLLFVISVKMES